MNTIEFDILCFDTDNKCRFQEDVQKFANILQGNKKLFSSEVKLENDKLSDKSQKIILQINKPDGLDNQDYASVFYIKCRFTCDKSIKELEEINSFRLELIDYLKIQGLGKIYITRDDLSQELLTRLYPKFNKLENTLRSYITKNLSIKEGIGSWFSGSLKNEAKEKVIKRKYNENIFSDQDHKTKDTQIYLIDFEDLGEIIYINSLGNIKTEDLFEKIAKADNLDNLKEDARKNIDKYFVKFKEVSFQEKWEFLKVIRNKVAHNGLTTTSEYLEADEKIDELLSFLQEIDDQIIKTISLEKDYLDIEKSNSISFYPSSQQYKEITKNELLKELRDYQEWCKSISRDFLGLKNFLHNRLNGAMGYHIGKAWDMLEKLEEDGYIKIFTWEDPKGIYPNQKAIEVLKELPVYIG